MTGIELRNGKVFLTEELHALAGKSMGASVVEGETRDWALNWLWRVVTARRSDGWHCLGVEEGRGMPRCACAAVLLILHEMDPDEEPRESFARLCSMRAIPQLREP